MGKWPEYPLESFVEPERSICYGIVQPGGHFEDGVPILRVNNFKDGGVDTGDVLRVDPHIESKYKRSRLEGGEILLTLVGTMGLSAIVPEELCGWNVARAVGIIPIRQDVDKRWLIFVLRSTPSQEFIQIHANTTVQATFNLRDLARLPIPMPPDSIRVPASNLLAALDDKIDLNRRMNETLEAMARALFKDWFVDFGPTRAKMALRGEAPINQGTGGEAPQKENVAREPYLAPDLWDLFPDRLDADGKPEGWGAQPFSQFVTIIGGGTPKTSIGEYWCGTIPWFSVTDTPPQGSVFCVDTEKKITHRGLEESSARLVREGVTIITARGTVGNLAMAGVPMTFNQSCYGLQSNALVGDGFVFFAAQHLVTTLQSLAHGSVFSTITRETFDVVNLPMTPESVYAAFESVAAPLLKRIKANVNESRSLAQTRDLLLPKLMSGEIRLAGQVAEEGRAS
ncbi:restriction endonuclease subunit S [Rhodospira trueperi]|uniref:Type I restriction enzyme, S subunit n=1 Tax=Rhodospira trueperi TaxID=69960 RepID=A0A1G7HG85_9PROT|nr:restriction endonuclease subunit S [Rhodospira trueperi]SDE99490.1 type I restriction enzyme, S subunit [Rhodospira trueperi]